MSQGPNRKAEAAALNCFAPPADGSRPVVKAMLALLEQPFAFSRDACQPGHFTASAFVLNPQRSHLLLIHHRKLGRWLQPGGHIEAADISLWAAAVREAREETGVSGLQPLQQGIFDVDIHDIPALKEHASHRHFDVRFAFVANSARLIASEEVKEARWVALQEVAQLNDEQSIVRPVMALERLRPSPLGG